jgi:hypothetical protein
MANNLITNDIVVITPTEASRTQVRLDAVRREPTHTEAVIQPQVSEGIPPAAWATWGVILLVVVIWWAVGAVRKRQKAAGGASDPGTHQEATPQPQAPPGESPARYVVRPTAIEITALLLFALLSVLTLPVRLASPLTPLFLLFLGLTVASWFFAFRNKPAEGDSPAGQTPAISGDAQPPSRL